MFATASIANRVLRGLVYRVGDLPEVVGTSLSVGVLLAEVMWCPLIWGCSCQVCKGCLVLYLSLCKLFKHIHPVIQAKMGKG